MIDMSHVPIDEYEREQRNGPRFVRINTRDIMATVFEPIRWIVRGYVPEGLSILAGRQKLGKTWLALDWAIAVACGGVAMGSIDCEQGDVLYIDLENGPRRIQGRINVLLPNERLRPDLSKLDWVNRRRSSTRALSRPWRIGGLWCKTRDWLLLTCFRG